MTFTNGMELTATGCVQVPLRGALLKAELLADGDALLEEVRAKAPPARQGGYIFALRTTASCRRWTSLATSRCTLRRRELFSSSNASSQEGTT
jgi:hypothetical protein